MYCPKCGKKLPKNATLCVTCDQDKIQEYLASQNAAKEEEIAPVETKEETKVEEKVEQTTEEVVDTPVEEKKEETKVAEEANTEENPTVEEVKEEVKEEIPVSESVVETPVVSPVPPKKKKGKKIFLKILGWLIGLAILGVGAYFAYAEIVGFEKLNWDESYGDYKLDYVAPSKIKLSVDFSDEKKVDKLKIKTTCGKATKKDEKISWDLTKALGECKIEVSYKLKKISKTVTVINPTSTKEEKLVVERKINYDSDEDIDYDGLTNKEEKKNKTNPELADTDMDGLDDGYEINTTKTDPTKKDTDGDGLNDGDEIELGLDPLKADSKGDGIKDGKRELSYEYETDGVKLSVTGTGNVASTVADVKTNTKISGKKGIIDKLYTLYTDGNMKEATFTVSYTDEELSQYGLNEDNLAIYYYNEKESKYEKVESVVDKENNTVTAKLKHFSPYVVADSELINEKTVSQVLFVLDNSWSMYTNEQYKEITGEEYSGGFFSSSKLEGNDADGVRFSLTKELSDKLIEKGNKVGLSEFRKDYANILPIGSSKKDINAKLGKMNGNFVTKDAGTNTSNALVKGLEEFKDDGSEKYIIILTDGQDTATSYNTDTVIKKANEKNIKICAIGFGEGASNTRLANIANATGCRFYSSSDAMGLSELFDNVETELSDNLVDIDDDGEKDGLLVADSGFIVNRDGFSFSNYASNYAGGHCYGMALFAELYYSKKLPLKMESKTAKKAESHAYNLTYSYFKNYANLYDYKLQTDGLKYYGYEGFKGFGLEPAETPSDYLTLNKDTLEINKKYRDEYDNAGIYTIDTKKTSLSKDEQKKKHGVYYKKYEDVKFDEDKLQTASNVNRDDLNLFNAIYALYIEQNIVKEYSSATDFTLWLRNVVGTSDSEFAGGNAFINILKTRMEQNEAPVISYYNGHGYHSINAISLVQDIENPNIYSIGVYDNNYPGEKRYLNMECNKEKCVTKANSYYDYSGEPVRVAASIDEHLSYAN